MKIGTLAPAIVVAALLIGITPSAHAQTTVTSGSESNSTAVGQSESESSSFNAGNSQSVTFEGTTIPRDRYQAPGIVAPTIVGGNNMTCDVPGVSAGISIPGGAATLGRGNRDRGCETIRSADAIARRGRDEDIALSRVLLCLRDEAIREAYQATGLTCEMLAERVRIERNQDLEPTASSTTEGPSLDEGALRPRLAAFQGAEQ